MKRVLSASLCLLMAWLSASAAPITRTQAQQKATAFMMERGWVNQKTLSRITTPRRAASNGANSLTYVFNAPDNKGFVILSGDDRTEPVIGYAEGGSFDEATIPVNMKGWLANIEEEIQWIQDNDVQVVSVHKVPSHNAISPLLSSKWGQDAPYNGLCPSGCPTGCLATAVAQVMYYHKWPNQTLEAIPGYTTYTTNKRLNSLPVTTFDWSSMSDTYRGGTNNAVAKLMQYVGYSVNMDYSSEGSGASERQLPAAMKTYFDYSQSIGLAYRENYSIESWDELVYNELAANRPVVYCGYSMGGGHAFVCDGYDGNGLYHINWGWDGYYDNYFRLSVLNPGTTSTIGSSETPDGYAMGQTVVYGIKPPSDGDTAPVKVPSISSLSLQSSTIVLVATGISGKIDLGMAIVNESTGSIDVKHSSSISPNPMTGNATYRTQFSNLGITSPGTYKLYPVYKQSGESSFSRFAMSSYYIEAVVESGGAATLTLHPVANLSANQLRFSGNVYVNRMTQLDYQLVNNGDEYNGMLYLFVSATANKGAALAYTSVAAEEGETQDLSFWFVPTTLDGVTIYIATDDKGNNVIGSLKLEDNNLEMADYVVRYNPLYISVTVKNNGSSDYTDDFVANIYQVGKTKSLGKLSQKASIPAGGTATFEYSTINLSNANDYTMKFSYRKNAYSSSLKEMDQSVVIDWVSDDPTSIQGMRADGSDSCSWYTVSGVQVAEPSAKGIYIRNGKKYVK